MRLLFDQNISHRVLKFLPELFQGSTSVKTEGLTDRSDATIWEFAKKHDLIIVTQDSDFNYLNSLYGFPPKIIWIRTGNMCTEEIARILSMYAEEIARFVGDDNFGCFEIIALKNS